MRAKAGPVNRSAFLTTVAITALAVGALSLLAPETLITVVKRAPPSPTAIVQARTVGVLLLSIGVLDLLVRRHEDSATMQAVLRANLFLQLAILPIDPCAYATGVYTTWGSFLPNTILHLVLAAGFVMHLGRMRVNTPAPAQRRR